jgi:leader peptidase (prepilin peptidase)/N-methyltransferase
LFDTFLLLFEQYPALFLVTLFVLGAVVGSFLNVVIYRLPIMMQREWRQDCLEFLEQPAEAGQDIFNLSVPRSRCGNCGHQITALENIPLISYLALGGKCSSCKTRISIQYPLVELFTAIVSVIVGWKFGVSLQTAAALFMTWCLIAASGIDIGHKLLPDSITLPLLWLGILLSLFNVFVDLEASVIGAMAGYMSLWSVFILFKIVTGKEGMGHGDFKLLAMIGAWLGWKLAGRHPDFIGSRRDRRDQYDRAKDNRTRHADSFRSLSCRGRLDDPALGRDADAFLFFYVRFVVATACHVFSRTHRGDRLG